ncbi:MAG: hypothetical protein PCALPYG88_5951 [uncultured Paraburkholderia sp.]|nr:MAG: hypothetical protein PCALPYG08_6153 [uncultured Paraburkholderia sp.]CAH2937399.1 MAG: hypothetical protein PCALPYG88_5951 [uncultured Paraburkholderia sp.]
MFPAVPHEHHFEKCSPHKTAALTRVAHVGHEHRSLFVHLLHTESISAIASIIGFKKNQR